MTHNPKTVMARKITNCFLVVLSFDLKVNDLLAKKLKIRAMDVEM